MRPPKINLPRKQKGFSLVELILVSGLAATGAIANFNSDKLELEHKQAQETGNLLYQYNDAVKQWISDNPAAPNATYTGSAWLKPTSCGGLSAVEYLPCSFPQATAASPIPFGKLSLTANVVTTGTAPTTVTTVTTTTSPFTVDDERSDLSGLSAITASAESKSGSFTSDPTTAAITMTNSSVSTGTGENWLRLDGSNSMTGNIQFDATSPGDFRQITNVFRISSLSGQALMIGIPGGAVAGENVIVDADQEIYGKLVVGNTNGDLNGIEVTQGDIDVMSGSVIASGDVQAGGNMLAAGNIQAGNVIANESMVAPRFRDANDSSYYIDANTTSKVNRLDATSVYTAQLVDPVDPSYLVAPRGTSNMFNINAYEIRADVFRDKDDVSYYIDPNSLSNLRMVTAEQVQVSGSAAFNGDLSIGQINSEGDSCPPFGGRFSRTGYGELLACRNGIWTRSTAYYPGTVTSGAACNSVASKGTFAFDASNELYVCK